MLAIEDQVQLGCQAQEADVKIPLIGKRSFYDSCMLTTRKIRLREPRKKSGKQEFVWHCRNLFPATDAPSPLSRCKRSRSICGVSMLYTDFATNARTMATVTDFTMALD